MHKETIELPWIFLTSIILFVTLTIGICILIYIFFIKRKQYFQQQKALEISFQQVLLQTQIEIQEHTLKTISQEIHDNVGQVLSLAKLNLGTFEDTESTYNQTKINDTKQLVSKAINDLRELSRSLHGDKITELGLLESIANELKILQNTGQYQTELKIEGDSYKLEPQKEMVLFRIVQESLNNAVKHSKAKNINVQMIYDPNLFKLSICDNGTGFNACDLQSRETGIGLKSMQNRAALIGGNFTLDSSKGNGTSVSIELLINNNLTS
ncbi:MAG: sensor histidine kinase [Ferruginibacter sp.]